MREVAGLATSPPSPGPYSGVSARPAGRRFDPWRLYLLAATILVPVLLTPGPVQLAPIDALNAAAIGIFLLVSAHRGGSGLRIPFLAPVTVISIGSLLSITNARSVPLSLLTLLQDVYLYLWLILLVNMMAQHGRLRPIRIAWAWTAIGTALFGLIVVLAHGHGSIAEIVAPRGARAISTFTNPNYFADYLVLSFFIVLSTTDEVGRRFRAFAVIVLLLGLLSTKSNGGAIALLSGLAAWGIARAYMRRIRPMAIVGAATLAIALAVLGWSLVSEWRLGAGALNRLREGSYAGRMEHSSESRLRIWSQLKETYSRSPLGIGPGNSRALIVPVEQRQRPGSLQSKEAHSDYLGFAIERGPIALVGLLMLIGEAFGRVGRFWSRLARGEPRPVWGSAFAAAMIAGLVASSVHSLVIEKLHFRHFWLFLAVLYAATEDTIAQPASGAESSSSLLGSRPALNLPRNHLQETK